jgi:hypothetical protein
MKTYYRAQNCAIFWPFCPFHQHTVGKTSSQYKLVTKIYQKLPKVTESYQKFVEKSTVAHDEVASLKHWQRRLGTIWQKFTK